MAVNTPHTKASDAGPTSAEVERLACGRILDDVFDRADEPADTHEQQCPYCQAARSSLRTLSEATDQIRAEDAADPTLQLNPARLTAILTIARAEMRRGRRIPLHQPRPHAGAGQPGADRTDPSLTISEQSIAEAIRHAGDQIAGLETRRCFIEVTEPDGAPTRTDPGRPSTIRARVTVSVSETSSVPALIAEFRARAMAAVSGEIGIIVAAVDVEVQDLHDAA